MFLRCCYVYSLEGVRLVLQEQDMLSSTVRIMDIESGVDVYTLQLGAPTSLARCSATQVKQCLCHTFTLITLSLIHI